MRVRAGEVERYLVDVIVDAIATCGEDNNENVQLLVIKAMHTLIATPTMQQIGEKSLLTAIRVIYHICMSSKIQVSSCFWPSLLKIARLHFLVFPPVLVLVLICPNFTILSAFIFS